MIFTSRSLKVRSILLLFLLVPLACVRAISASPTVGEVFPSVEGVSLERRAIRVPEDFKGEKVLLLIGFEQNAQFDIDRWILSIKQLNLNISLVEIPAIRGYFPRVMKGYIDKGMRSGIPKEDWSSVVTVYSDADDLAHFVGTENALNSRVLLLNKDGKVVWFHDRGYSADKMLELQKYILE